jgi:vanadium chloroperoxidase
MSGNPLAKARYWIDAIIEANRRDHTNAIVGPGGDQRGPFRSARALAIAMMAMHDAHARVTGIGTPYRPGNPAPIPPGADADAAAAAAAMMALRALYPKQEHLLHEHWQDYIDCWPTAPASAAFGQAVAKEILAWRDTPAEQCLLAGQTPYVAWGPYDHGPDPLSPGQGYAGVDWGGATPFLAARQPLEPPPGAPTAPAGLPPGTPMGYAPGAFYDQEFDEARRLGSLHSAERSAEQEEIGIYWGYDGPQQIGTPPRLYMQVALAVLDARMHAPGLPAFSASSLLQVLSAAAVAMGDAGIQAWHYKYSPIHMLWRPVLGIRQADNSRPGTPRDPTWTPLGKPDTNGTAVGTTPDFPAYPSGHATFGAACFWVLRRWIKQRENLSFQEGDIDPIAFSFVSDEYDGRNVEPRTGQPRRLVTRHYDSLWRAIVENSESRIFLGVHWRMDGISKGVPGAPVHGRPAKPAELGPLGGVALGVAIGKAVAAARGF